MSNTRRVRTLQVLKRSGTEAERNHARRIQPVRTGACTMRGDCHSCAAVLTLPNTTNNAHVQVIKNEHFLLSTLLLFNALAAEVRSSISAAVPPYRRVHPCGGHLSLNCGPHP